MDKPEIKRITASRVSMELVYEADEVRESVADYIGRGEVYAATVRGRIVGQYILLHTRPFTAEIVNIAVPEDCRGRGIGSAMIRHAAEEAKNRGFRVLEIGTGYDTPQMELYRKCGFTVTHIERGYFTRFCPEPIFENGRLLTDMVRMQMYL